MNKYLFFLLVKDMIQGNFLKYHLQATGCKDVILFQNQSECFYSIRKNVIPDFIIADTSLDGMTDKEFLRFIKTGHPEISVIFLSENDDLSHISGLLEDGATDYILKDGGKNNWMDELVLNLHYLIKEELDLR
jgi:DNA-binding NarL/FixJ family response regulator